MHWAIPSTTSHHLPESIHSDKQRTAAIASFRNRLFTAISVATVDILVHPRTIQIHHVTLNAGIKTSLRSLGYSHE